MELQFRCPSCDKLLQVPGRLAGKKVRCTKCEKVVTAPEGDEERADLLVSDEIETYLVEVKGKEVSDECQELIAEANKEGTASINRVISYRNRLDGIVSFGKRSRTNPPSVRIVVCGS